MIEEKGIEIIPKIPKSPEEPAVVSETSAEAIKEAILENPTVSLEKPQENVRKPLEKPAPERRVEGGLAAQSTVASVQKQREEAIDKILSEGLSEVFLKMTPAKQKEFQKTGEETVKKISVLLGEAKVKVNKIIELIKRWLKLIPGVNNFFLEQETKLKVDKILKLKK
jgi:hypothetical protein